MKTNAVQGSIAKNKAYLSKTIGTCADIQYRELAIPAFGNTKAMIVYINNLVDTQEIDQAVLKPLMAYRRLPAGIFGLFRGSRKRMTALAESGIFIRQAHEMDGMGVICDEIMQGNTCLFADGYTTAILLTTRKVETRAISEPITESEVRGPRDGFIENIDKNTALIRVRIKDYALRFDTIKLGDRTKTNVSIAYIDTLVNRSVLAELKTRLSRIKADSVLASSYVEELIEDEPYTIFPQIEHTERPDKTCAAILEGRIALLVDNTPYALLVPTVFWNFIQTSGDYYDRYYLGTFYRWIRLLALMLSFTMSSLYVLLASYHQEMLPTVLALKIAEGREGVPFPALIEALIMDILLEVIKEAGLRMPNPVGSTVSIVGTFIMGQAAIMAGIASPPLIIFITISAICSYAIPSYSLNNSLRIVRFPLLLITGCFGILGFLGGIIVIIIHLLSLRSFGEPFFAPVIPFDAGSNKDVMVRAPWWKMARRPGIAQPQDSIRQAEGLKPGPPKKNARP